MCPETTYDKREKSIYEQYQTIIANFITELEVRDTEYPIEIFNEIRATFTHLSRYKLQNSIDDLVSAERHVKRAILDCFKYMCISIAEELNQFRSEYKKVDLKIADDGKFLPELDRLEHLAKTSYIEAKKAEIKGELSENELYALFENAYNNYKNVTNFLSESNESVLFASSHSKKNNLITIISTIVTAISIITAIVFAII